MSTTATQEIKRFKPQVSSHGYANANIFFLAGYPLNEDISSGKALSGTQESTLDQFLRPHKISVKSTYRADFVKEKLDFSGTTPKKLFAALSKIDLKAYLDLLFQEIKDVNPNVIVPLDDVSLAAVFPHINSIRKPKGRKFYSDMYRGSILPLRDDFQALIPTTIRVIPTLGPQLLNQNWTARVYVRTDYKRIAENSVFRAPIKRYGLCWAAKNSTEVFRFFSRGLEKNLGFVTFDIETYGGLITMISFCFDGFESCSIPLSPYYFPEIPRTELAMIWRLVAQMLANPIPKCNQNIKFDWIILERHGFFVRNVVHDTMIKGKLLYPELPCALDFLTSIYTPLAYYKDEGKEFDPRKDKSERLQIYNAQDSLSAAIVNQKQEEELKENGQHELYHQELAPLILIYKDIDEARIIVDDSQKQRLFHKYTGMLDRELQILRTLIGNPTFNPRSPKQVGELLYEELKFPKRQRTNEEGEKVWKTDKETLDELLIKHPEDNRMGKVGTKILATQTLLRKLSKVLEYIDTPQHPDGTIGGNSNLGGPETGRTSFSKTIDEILLSEERAKLKEKRTERLGRSLQTITKHGFQIDEELFDGYEDFEIASDLRSMFVPPKGWVFVEGDGSQAEARAVAVLAEDWELLESFDKKPKIHAKTAALIFNIDVNTITKDSPSIPRIGIAYYDLGKRIRHAGNYRLKAFRLSQMTHIAMSECARMLNVFHANNPKIQTVFHAEIDKILKETRIIETPFRRKRQFFDRINDHSFKEATAQIPQSTISDQTKFTMPRIKNNLKGYGLLYRFLTEQHDGILSLVRDFYVNDYSAAFKKYYERPIDFRVGSLKRDCQLVIPCELSKSSENWQNLKEFTL